MTNADSTEPQPASIAKDDPDHFAGRRHMLRTLCEELVGPAPRGREIDLLELARGSFPEQFTSDGPYIQKGSGEEILCVEPPGLRYGIGVLFPWGATHEVDGKDGSPAEPTLEAAQAALSPAVPDAGESGVLTVNGEESIKQIAKRNASSSGEPRDDDFDLSSANMRRPNSMAVSFLAKLPQKSDMIIRVTGGRYEEFKFKTDKGREVTWWKRQGLVIEARFSAAQLKGNGKAALITPDSIEKENLGPIDLRVEVFCRPTDDDDHRLFTVCVINRTKEGRGNNARSIFQSAFDVQFEGDEVLSGFMPYPKPTRRRRDDEEQSLELLYRDFETFAIGHGCGADWESSESGGLVTRIKGVPLPIFETPSITPEIFRSDNSTVEAPMAPLAGLIKGDDGFSSLREIVDLYNDWIVARETEANKLSGSVLKAAQSHIEACKKCLSRMRDGLKFLQEDQLAASAFRWANEAILAQQLRSSRSARKAEIDSGRIIFDRPYPEIDLKVEASGRGKWRPFQIAFLLMSMRSAVIEGDVERETVDLVWFPTGGGKTEAYFGLAAFSAFYRRLREPVDVGVHVLMRYTLRLLTAQQFQRASGLICAMEAIRRREQDRLSTGAFSIGIWLGGDTTPNNRADARAIVRQLQKDSDGTANKFLVTKCPWCSAQIGPIKSNKRNAPKVLGYHDNGTTVELRCSDGHCEFSSGLPIYVIDDDIYAQRPTLVIGTVDKFAMLAWKPEARSLFGFDEDGGRDVSPPGLIIQDELHLISGPLGSMVGLYEGVIEDLCSDRRGEKEIKPKIVCSTATIRRFQQQAKALFAREATALFPPPGLSVSDSFFSRYARKDGVLSPGRLFVGVYAPALGSIQTAEVRVLTSLLQAPCSLPENARDPWWTTLAFLNSLREIGTAATLFQSDIPDRLKVLQRRLGVGFKEVRRLYEIMELTSRLRSDEVPRAIEALEIVAKGKPEPKKYPVDACLASNIIEVGVDIDRLSLLAIVGQPKSTSQYIQVAGRVGRRWFERPGLVVTIFGPSNSRDRSHYEKFRSYHERLYAQVEPTSVTPFSAPVLDRALHAVMAAYVRQSGKLGAKPFPMPGPKLEELRTLLTKRVAIVDEDEAESFEAMFTQRSKEWEAWKRTEWKAAASEGDVGLLTPAGSYLPSEDWNFSWPTPQSMRNVDAECFAEITRSYISLEETIDGGLDV